MLSQPTAESARHAPLLGRCARAPTGGPGLSRHRPAVHNEGCLFAWAQRRVAHCSYRMRLGSHSIRRLGCPSTVVILTPCPETGQRPKVAKSTPPADARAITFLTSVMQGNARRRSRARGGRGEDHVLSVGGVGGHLVQTGDAAAGGPLPRVGGDVTERWPPRGGPDAAGSSRCSGCLRRRRRAAVADPEQQPRHEPRQHAAAQRDDPNVRAVARRRRGDRARGRPYPGGGGRPRAPSPPQDRRPPCTRSPHRPSRS